MRFTRFITVTAIFTAILICVQLALSGIAGVELVTVFLLAFCFSTGVKSGITVAVCFSTLRCFLFGFYPSVIILYLVYYTGFAAFFGFLGNRFKREATFSALIWATILSTAFTAIFTLLDDIITPLFYGFDFNAAKAYFYASLPFMLSQCICAVVSVIVLFIPLCKVFSFAATDKTDYNENNTKR